MHFSFGSSICFAIYHSVVSIFFAWFTDLTELQVAMSDVNGQYEALGVELKDHLGHQQASLGLRQKAKQGTEELKNWLTERELSLKQAQTASPSRPEVLRAQAQENKACQALCWDNYQSF